MTITTNPARDEYTSSPGQTVFNYTFKIYANTDLNVYVTPEGQEADDAADISTDYTVDSNTIGDEAGGFITFNNPLADGDLVTILSNIPYNRTVDYQNNGDFRPDTVNSDNDRQVSQIKQIESGLSRTLQFPSSLQNATGVSMDSPESGKYVRWKSDLSGLENVELPAGQVAAGGVVLIYPDVATMKASTDENLIPGITVATQGYYTAGDGGDALYLISTVQAADEYGDHTLANSNVALIQIGSNVSLNQFGYGIDVTTNDAALNAAIGYCKAAKTEGEKYGPITLQATDSNISGTKTLGPYLRIKALSNAILRHTGGTTAFHVSYDSDSDSQAFPVAMNQNPFNIGNIISGDDGSIALKGDASIGSVAVEYGLRSGSANSRTHTAWGNVSNVAIDNFETGLFFNRVENYLLRHYNIMVTNCADIFKTAVGPNINSGEQIDFVSCGFHNSDRIGFLRTQMNLNFNGCSFDFMTGDEGFRVDADFQKLRFQNGWIEAYSATQAGALVTSNTGVDAHRLHVTVENNYIQPRDKLQQSLIKGSAQTDFNNNTIVVNRFDNYPESADAAYHYILQQNVQPISVRGNTYFDQMMAVSPHIGNINQEFNVDSVGTTAQRLGDRTAITGWTIAATAGQSDVQTAQIAQSPEASGFCARIDQASGTFCDLVSDKIAVSTGQLCHGSIAIYTPGDAALNVTMRVRFYDKDDNLIQDNPATGDYSDYPSDRFVTHKASIDRITPAGAFTADYRCVIGGYSSDIYVYGATVQPC